MGIVYKASLRTDAAESRRVVALKQLLHASDRNRETLHEADQLEGLLRELTIGVLLPKTPSICAFIGAVSHPIHGPLLVYEYIDGINMDDYFELQNVKHKAKFRRGKTQWKPKVKTALAWGEQIFRALDALHVVQLIHRDVKPSNIMLFNRCNDEYASLKIIDFGLARRNVSSMMNTGNTNNITPQLKGQPDLDRPDKQVNMTVLTGTPRYMAPEIAQGDAGYGAKVDVYSATMVLYFMFTGVLPFERVPPQAIPKLAAEGRRPDLQAIKSTSLRELCAFGWEAVRARTQAHSQSYRERKR